MTFDRVGHAVAVSGNVVIVSARQNYSGILEQMHPRFEVQQVAVTANNGTTVGKTFRLGWNKEFAAVPRGVLVRGEQGLGDRVAYVSVPMS